MCQQKNMAFRALKIPGRKVQASCGRNWFANVPLYRNLEWQQWQSMGNQMKRGYHLIIPDFIEWTYPDFDMACRCLSWFIKNYEPLQLHEQGQVFRVIPVCYMGCTPGIGFYSEQPQQNSSKLANLAFSLEENINRFVSEEMLMVIAEASKGDSITWMQVCCASEYETVETG